MDDDANERPTAAVWCPLHMEPARTGCRGCAGDHAAGEHAMTPCQYCRRCHPRPPKSRRPARPHLAYPDHAALAAHDVDDDQPLF